VSITAELIDVRQLPPPQRHPVIFGAFDALAPGEGFELASDHDPVPLYMQFERTRAGQFGWRYLEQGPRQWRVRIERTGAGAKGGSTSGCCGGCGGGSH